MVYPPILYPQNFKNFIWILGLLSFDLFARSKTAAKTWAANSPALFYSYFRYVLESANMERETKISASATNSEKTTIEVGLQILGNHLQFRIFYYSSLKTNSTRKANSSSSVLGNKIACYLHSSNTRTIEPIVVSIIKPLSFFFVTVLINQTFSFFCYCTN